MQKSTKFLAAILAGAGMWLTGSAAEGGVVPLPPPGHTRIALADAVIVGEVDALEPLDIKIDNTTYRIAVVKIKDGLKGAKDVKAVRIAFIPLAKPDPKIIRTGARPVQLEPGQEGLFILKKIGNQDIYTIGGVVGYYINHDKNKDFDKEVQAARASAKAMDNPQAALKSRDAEERLLAASILITKYRTNRGPNVKLEPIDAEESKQIMQALADADWTNLDFRSVRPNPTQLFQKLGVTAKDGFMVVGGANFQTAAQTWVRENAQKFRIQRFVAD
jgi:hypothetical protein